MTKNHGDHDALAYDDPALARNCQVCGQHMPGTNASGAEGYTQGYNDFESLRGANMLDLARRVAEGIPSNAYGIGFRTALELHNERQAV